MKPALPTAPVAYGLDGPSATATLDNATPAGLHLSHQKFCPNKWVRLWFRCLQNQSYPHSYPRQGDVAPKQQ